MWNNLIMNLNHSLCFNKVLILCKLPYVNFEFVSFEVLKKLWAAWLWSVNLAVNLAAAKTFNIVCLACSFEYVAYISSYI